jgi:hypothetical protein
VETGKVENGEWRTESGEWGTERGKRKVENGELKISKKSEVRYEHFVRGNFRAGC